jgi:hypothetical protein
VFWAGDTHDLHRASTRPYTHTCTHTMRPSSAPRTDRRSHTPSDKEAQWQCACHVFGLVCAVYNKVCEWQTRTCIGWRAHAQVFCVFCQLYARWPDICLFLRRYVRARQTSDQPGLAHASPVCSFFVGQKRPTCLMYVMYVHNHFLEHMSTTCSFVRI